MPELPDVTLYVERIQALFAGQRLERVRLASPFVLRSANPPLSEAFGRKLEKVTRIGKRIVLELSGERFLVIHLMIAGRLRQRELGAAVPKKVGLLAFDFETGSLVFTEASSKKRASLHYVAGRAALADFQRGGIEPLEVSLEEFSAAITRENRTLKRALTDPRILSGIGNAYSDEILFTARLSPVKRSQQLAPDELARLYRATQETLALWTQRLRDEVGSGFPEQVTAFREEMAVHGRYKQPCPVCGTAVQRIRHADNEINYCPRCQTEGKVLADRSLSRLLRGDWPRSIEELEERIEQRAPAKAPSKAPAKRARPSSKLQS
ncbi:MAG TPA: DNA-formamidopyrimidine glycosylase family protein [Polyangiaceae bacterium]|nr:DNA-formamidopyrimidine glycosylase family protein [Polyangiaceae bacterium]